MLQLISIVMVIYSYFLIKTTLPNLPQVIPTHFNAAGVANGWGSPDTLWVLLMAQGLTTAVFLVIPYVAQRNPGAAHFGSRRFSDFPPAQRARMVALLNDMAAYLSIVMNVFFVFMLREILQAATQPTPRIQPLWPMVLLAGGVFGIMMFYLGRFRRVARGEDGDDPQFLQKS